MYGRIGGLVINVTLQFHIIQLYLVVNYVHIQIASINRKILFKCHNKVVSLCALI